MINFKTMKRKIKKNRKGFTLHEILTIIVIIGLLSTAVFVFIGNVRASARDTQRVSDVGAIYSALEMYHKDNGVYPTVLTPGNPISSNGKVYLASIPSNPLPKDDEDCYPDYVYEPSSDSVSYSLSYCLGKGNDSIDKGKHVAIPAGPDAGVLPCDRYWQFVDEDDSQGFSESYAPGISIVIDSNHTPYVVYGDFNYDWTSDGVVMGYNGSSWEKIGNDIDNNIGFPTIAIDSNNTVYVSYVYQYDDDDGIGIGIVKKYNGSSWEKIGNDIDNNISYPSVAIDSNNTVYVAYRDENDKATVVKYNGSSWEKIGDSSLTESINSISIDFNNSNVPYIAYADTDSGTGTMKKYNGLSWEKVGNEDFSNDFISRASIAFDNNNTPHVSYIDNPYAIDSKGVVKKYNGSSWEKVGNDFFEGIFEQTSFAIDNSTPYVIYISSKVMVKKYNGSSWEEVGEFPEGGAYFPSIAIDSNTPYIAYADYAFGGKAIVKKYECD
ncbi:MAG: hypothetical protein ABIG10_02890 [bacterium]